MLVAFPEKFGLINLHLFNILPAISSGKVRESLESGNAGNAVPKE